MSGPLEGIRILDLTTILLGPWATQIMGDMGADVIKIEAPGGDPIRDSGPARHPGMSAVFLNTNRNKRSIVLDLKQPAALEALMRLVEGADVFVHNMRAAAAERLGLSYDAMKARNPTLVYCAAYGYGRRGRYSERGAYDDMIQAASGLAALQGRRFGTPLYVPTMVVDKTLSLGVVASVSMALFHRERTGLGQAIEMPMFETMSAFLMVEHLYGRTFEPAIGGTGYPRALSPDRTPYQTKDGYIAALPYNDRQWRNFFALVGREDMGRDPRFATMEARVENIDALYAALAEQMAERSTDEWTEALIGANIPMAPVNEIDDLIDDPHLSDIGFWRTEEHPSEGTIRTTDVFWGFSQSPGSLRRPVPRLGQHTREVLREGGLDDGAIEALCASKGAQQDATIEGT